MTWTDFGPGRRGARYATLLLLAACTIGVGGLATSASTAYAQEVPTPPKPPRAPRPRPSMGSEDQGFTRIDTTLAFSPTGSVELDLVSGDMKVSTWDRNEVRVVATATGDARIQFDASRSHLDMEQSWHDRWSRDNSGERGTVSYQVTVPAGVRATLGSVAGTINAAGIKGGAEISTVSGAVDVRDIGGEASIEAVSGRVTLANVQGDAHVESVSGAVNVTNVSGSLSAESVSGPIILTDVRGARVRANTVSGALDFTGAINPAGHYDFETHSGRATLRLASNANAAVSVNTFSGSVANDYPGAVRRQRSDDDDGQTYEYTIGHGDARVRVETFSGRVIITQGNR